MATRSRRSSLNVPELHLTKKDFRVDWFRGKGAGGQHRNKHANCCRITHRESGLMATGQSFRDRPSNQAEAFEKLAAMVIAHYAAPEEQRRPTEVIRTYNERRNEVLDHRTRAKMELREALDDIGPLINENLRHHVTESLSYDDD